MIEIVSYKTDWLTEFHEIASVLRSRLGDLALRIDHIGSTSVPGLAAKDIIDIQITVKQLDNQIINAMTSLDYIQARVILKDHYPIGFAGSETKWKKLFFYSPPNQRRTHTHIRTQGSANQRYALLFRDYLREKPDTAQTYAELKRRLAQYIADSDMYPDVKDPAVDLIYFAAEKWAETIHWQPGDSDA
ncbi:MAG: GrpB family protein [Gammaproteobacteria bacterium]|nr:MAG: GrpB family protein [Gammaproteobacteria bacterium]